MNIYTVGGTMDGYFYFLHEHLLETVQPLIEHFDYVNRSNKIAQNYAKHLIISSFDPEHIFWPIVKVLKV